MKVYVRIILMASYSKQKWWVAYILYVFFLYLQFLLVWIKKLMYFLLYTIENSTTSVTEWSQFISSSFDCSGVSLTWSVGASLKQERKSSTAAKNITKTISYNNNTITKHNADESTIIYTSLFPKVLRIYSMEEKKNKTITAPWNE